MDDQTTKIVTQTVADLAAATVRNTVGAVSDKVKAAKKGRDQAKTITELESLINELINDKIEVERIAKTLENELVSQQISDSDITFIVDTIIPLVEKITKSDPKRQEYIVIAKQLLSKETLTVMQLIGFNYREAIGAPLTRLCANAIQNIAQTEDKRDIEKINAEYQVNLVRISQDKEAYERFAKLIGRNELISSSNSKGEPA